MTLQSMLTISLLLFLSLDNLLAFSTRSLSHSLRPTSSNVQQSSASLRRRASQSPAPVVASAATTADLVNEGDAFESSSADSKPSFPVVLWRFTRPHTIIGSALAIPALHMLAAPSLMACFQPTALLSIAFCTVPSLLMNLYITGLNQITDVEIDKVNKPYLPIAAGILSKKRASVIVVISLLASLWMGTLPLATKGLNVALWGSAILGTLYSMEPFRLKRFPLLAAFCIVAVRGTIINASFFAHAKAVAFGTTIQPSSVGVISCLLTDRACFLSSLFFCIFGVVIALMKDVPDVAGDMISNVKTFSVRLGQDRMFHLGKRILVGLFLSFGAGFLSGAFMAPTAILTAFRGLTGASCVAAAISVRSAARKVDPTDSRQVYEYYMFLWKLFYLSYFALPFAR